LTLDHGDGTALQPNDAPHQLTVMSSRAPDLSLTPAADAHGEDDIEADGFDSPCHERMLGPIDHHTLD